MPSSSSSVSFSFTFSLPLFSKQKEINWKTEQVQEVTMAVLFTYQTEKGLENIPYANTKDLALFSS